VDVILALVGLGALIWAFSPPRKHKDFSLHDREEATSRAFGGGDVPDFSKLEPDEIEQKRKKHEGQLLPEQHTP
jgi:hypothetical protein